MVASQLGLVVVWDVALGRLVLNGSTLTSRGVESLSLLLRNRRDALLLLDWVSRLFRHDDLLFNRSVKQHLFILVLVEQHVLVVLNAKVEYLLVLVEVAVELLLFDLVCLSILIESLAMLIQEHPKFLLDCLRIGFGALVLTALALEALLLQSFGVAKRVERMVGRAHARADASEHHDLGLFVGEEAVP